MDFKPTAEQAAARDSFLEGGNLVIEALAGTGKTSTLQLLANARSVPMQYIAFNKSIVVDAGRKMPKHVRCNTAHSLAWQAIGHQFKDRIENSYRMKTSEIAARLGLELLRVKVGTEFKVLSPEQQAGLVMKALRHFCHSADPEPTESHFPYVEGIDLHDAFGERGWGNNRMLRAKLLPRLLEAWDDIQRPDGQLKFEHDHYLKIWQLTRPQIGAEVVLFDEAQDANPVISAVVSAQDAQKVWVGDSQQQIYEFTGAINAMSKLEGAATTHLTKSFRFGPPIAGAGNVLLERLTDLRLKGYHEVQSRVDRTERPDCILCRTNANAVELMLESQRQGRRPYLVGEGKDVLAFARGVDELMEKGSSTHSDLMCFGSWEEVREYVEQDAHGSDLRLMVDLVGRFGTAAIRRALQWMPREGQADLVVSTAHKAKGREWPIVSLGSDFRVDLEAPDEELDKAEMRLMYVAVTRARGVLDVSRHSQLALRLGCAPRVPGEVVRRQEVAA